MLTYKDVEKLPVSHPLYQQFWNELTKMEDMYKGEADIHDLDDEQSLAYFNRYIAGDR